MESDILLAFRFMRMQINIDIEKYQQLCELNRQKAMKRWEKQTNDAAAFSAMHKKEKEKKNEKENEKEKENEREVVGRINSSSSSSTVSDIANGNEEEDEEDIFFEIGKRVDEALSHGRQPPSSQKYRSRKAKAMLSHRYLIAFSCWEQCF